MESLAEVLAEVVTERRDAFFDAVRLECVQAIYGYWSTTHEPIGIERAVKLIQDRIAAKTSKHLAPDERWHFAKLPDELTIRRRINEAADARRYSESPPLRCLGMRMYLGVKESQYQPFEV